jgi:hypothetical protein
LKGFFLFFVLLTYYIAIPTYLSALDVLKQTADFNWHGALLESYYAALFLTLIYKAGLGPQPTTHFPSNSAGTDQPNSHIIWSIPTLSFVLSSNPSALSSGPLRAFLCDLPDRYREILQLYDRGSISGPNAPGFCPLLAPEASLCMAKLLAGLFQYGFDGVFINGAACSLTAILGASGGSSGVGATAADGGASMGLSTTRPYQISSGIGGVSESSSSNTSSSTDEDRMLMNPAGCGVSRAEGLYY